MIRPNKLRSIALTAVVAMLPLLNVSCGRSAAHYLEKGNKLVAAKLYADAALTYRKAIQIDPHNGEAYYQLGLVELRLGDAVEAYRALSRAVDLLPARDDAKVVLAELVFRGLVADRQSSRALYDLVTKLSDQLLARNPKSYDGLRLKGALAVADRKFELADEFFRKANEAKPMQPELVLSWVGVLFQGNRPAEGEKLALQFIAGHKTYAPVYDELVRQYMLLKRVADAERTLKSKVSNNPTDARASLQLAEFYVQTSKTPEMEAVLKRMLDNPAGFPKAHLDVGDFYGSLQRWQDAIQQYEQGVQADPKAKVVYLERIADVWLAQGKGEKAKPVVDEILKEQPSNDQAKAVRASLLLASGQPESRDEAVSQFQALVQKSAGNAVWHYNLGRALFAKGDAEGAHKEFQEAIRLRKDLIAPRVALADLSQARGDYQTALRYDDEILAIQPNLGAIQLQRAASLVHMGRDAEARSQLKGLEKIFPKEVQIQSAVSDLKQKNYVRAEDEFRKLFAQDPKNSEVLSGLVQTYVEQNQFDRAQRLLTEELGKRSGSDMPRALLADTALRAGKYDLAIEQYRTLLAVKPQSSVLYLGLAAAYKAKGNLSGAAFNIRKAASLAPTEAEPLALLGEVLAASGQVGDAIAALHQALKLQPDHLVAMNNLAFLLVESGGSLDEAQELAQKALRIAPGQANIVDTLGWIYLKRNQTDSALQTFSGLSRAHPENPEFRYHLGMALLQKGDREAAKAELKAALSDNPSAQMRQRIDLALSGIG